MFSRYELEDRFSEAYLNSFIDQVKSLRGDFSGAEDQVRASIDQDAAILADETNMEDILSQDFFITMMDSDMDTVVKSNLEDAINASLENYYRNVLLGILDNVVIEAKNDYLNSEG